MTSRFPHLLLICGLALLAGCDALGLESATAQAERRDAEGKAVGGACRHAGRAIEDCYTLNKRTDKAAMFAGWREMNDYMRENKIEAVPPAPPPPALAQETTAAEEPAAKADKSAKPGGRRKDS